MKKTCFLTLLVLISVINLQCQDRINRAKLSFVDSSDILKHAVGWYYNDNIGEWVDYANVIYPEVNYKNEYKILQGSYMMSKTEQNFISIQTKTVIYNNQKLYVLIITKWDGEYKYPNIQEDWMIFKTTIGYIFTLKEYSKLYNLADSQDLSTNRITKIGSPYMDYSETRFLDYLQTDLGKNIQDNSPIYVLSIMKAKNGVIRFFLPSSSEYYFPNDPNCYLKSDFKVKYFETDSLNFSKIIIRNN